MTKAKNKISCATIAAICYICCFFYETYWYYISHQTYFLSFSTDVFLDALLPVALLIMAISLGLKNVNVLFGAICIRIVYYISSLVRNATMWVLLSILAYISMATIIYLAIKKIKIVKAIWFLPGVVRLINLCIMWYKWDYFFLGEGPFCLTEVAGLFFAGIWAETQLFTDPTKLIIPQFIKNFFSATTTPAGRENISPKKKTALIGGADEIKMYKELLDSGVITQEEFEAKKKQIL